MQLGAQPPPARRLQTAGARGRRLQLRAAPADHRGPPDPQGTARGSGAGRAQSGAAGGRPRAAPVASP